MLDYYDGIIVAIFGCVLSGLCISMVTGLGFHVGLFGGTLVATVFICDAIFRHPPVSTTDPEIAMQLVDVNVIRFRDESL